MGNHRRRRRERAVRFAPTGAEPVERVPLLGCGRLTYTEAIRLAGQAKSAGMANVEVVASSDTGWSVSAQLREPAP